jgi:2-polyprenyl-3-methyl-5-hydroxy-6-metoxy-1,4-benzoquinol methylase
MQMEFTGERYIPELLSPKISYEHWHRYIFASRFCVQKKVLDLACGEGYGSAYLAAVAHTVTGIDISDDAVQHAKMKYNLPNVQFLQSDVSRLNLESKGFDTIVSFETLEHLTADSQELFMAEAVRLLNAEGILLVSTPNKKIYSDNANYVNPYHLSEFYKPDFENFLQRHFKSVVVFSQQIIGGSIISDDDENIFNIDRLRLGQNGFIPGTNEKQAEMEYLIGICSQNKFSPVSGSILLDNDNKLITDH